MESRTHTSKVALVAAAVLGGAAALGGAVALDQFEDGPTTVVTPAVTQNAIGDSGLSVGEIYRRSSSGVVQITARTDGGSGQALGSGFVIDKAGHIVTNYHVIEGASEIDVSFSNRDTLDAELIGSDPSTDLALLKVDTDAGALTPLPIGDSDRVVVGDPVVAIGNPFGLERTVTAGIVSALQRAVTAPDGRTIDHVIQTDAAVNSGNSGGPLLNARGEVVGVNSQISTAQGSSGNVGIAFAVPSNTVTDVVEQLKQSGSVDRAYLGVTLAEVEPEIARTFGLPVDSGVLVQTVEPGSAAADAGVKAGTEDRVVAGQSYRTGGDLIVGADGQRVANVADLRDALSDRRPGDTIELEIYRDGEKQTVSVKLGRLPASPQG